MHESKPPSDALVFFGATGDLAYKKIFPALQSLTRRGRLNVPVIGVAFSGWNRDQLIARAKASCTEYGGSTRRRSRSSRPTSATSTATTKTRRPSKRLKSELGKAKRPTQYLAIPPSMFTTWPRGSRRQAPPKTRGWSSRSRSGRDLASARELNQVLHRFFPEESVFRIDHYLGKEAVQNILYFRFANAFLSRSSNRHYVENVQITLTESFGVKGRGKFYDETGVIRDVIQNHLLQVVSYLAMEPPSSTYPEAIRDEQAKVLRTGAADEHRAHGARPVQRDTATSPGVAKDSYMATYAALQLWIDSWRWAGVPFFVRAGKSLKQTMTEVVIELNNPPQVVFKEALRTWATTCASG